MTYRIVHELVEILLEVIGGRSAELRVLSDVRGHPRRLSKLQDFVDFDDLHAQLSVELQVR